MRMCIELSYPDVHGVITISVDAATKWLSGDSTALATIEFPRADRMHWFLSIDYLRQVINVIDAVSWAYSRGEIDAA